MYKLFNRSTFHKTRSCISFWQNQKITNLVTCAYKQFSTQTQSNEDIHCIITEKENITGNIETLEFKAETRKLLDIVAKSLYSDKEIFIRELVSNASDALEKLRYIRTTGLNLSPDAHSLEIHIKTDENKKLFIIQDTGVGMTKKDVINNLGTIAKSGSQEFIENVNSEGNGDTSIIGKFGVGFYSSFMVADKVDLFTKFHNSKLGIHWESVGNDGSFNVAEADNVDAGTKIVLHLRKDCESFCDEKTIERILTKYSSYINTPIFLNGRKLHMMQPLWLKDQSKVSDIDHEQFYQFITSNTHGTPRYTMSFKTDVPIDIKALFYVPPNKPSLYEISRENDAGVSLYSRKVMIMNRTQKLLPSWLRFLKGVVESDDIPLNLSRELLQDSALIAKINRVISGKVLRYLQDQVRKEPAKFNEFYKDFGLYLKEGIINTFDQNEKETIARLLRFETNKLPAGETTSLQEYSDRMKAGTRKVFFLASPNRHLAETSPYMEAISQQDCEVLYLYEPYDEIVLMQLGKFEGKTMCSVENEQSDATTAQPTKPDGVQNEQQLSGDEGVALTAWMESRLQPRVAHVTLSSRLSSHPCLVTVRDMGAVRYYMRTVYSDRTDKERETLMSATLELNPSHALVKRLATLHHTDEALAGLLATQLLENAMVQAGLVADSRPMMANLTELLTRAFDKI